MRVRSALVRAGLARPPLEPHDLERDMHLLYVPGPGSPVASVPHPVSPLSSTERCARAECGGCTNDPTHHIAEG